eukprot:SAG31_NODE_2646_length_5307_cov_1.777074_1_plen_279_part_00
MLPFNERGRVDAPLTQLQAYTKRLAEAAAMESSVEAPPVMVVQCSQPSPEPAPESVPTASPASPAVAPAEVSIEPGLRIETQLPLTRSDSADTNEKNPPDGPKSRDGKELYPLLRSVLRAVVKQRPHDPMEFAASCFESGAVGESGMPVGRFDSLPGGTEAADMATGSVASFLGETILWPLERAITAACLQSTVPLNLAVANALRGGKMASPCSDLRQDQAYGLPRKDEARDTARASEPKPKGRRRSSMTPNAAVGAARKVDAATVALARAPVAAVYE